MPSLGATRSHWPVVAWIRLKVPRAAPPVLLTPGPPPLPDPPLEEMHQEPIATDPRRRVYAFEEEVEGGLLRLVWDSEDPEFLEAELRAPVYGGRLPPDRVRAFWERVKRRTERIGPLPIDAADPRP